jgi:hypothetical protein
MNRMLAVESMYGPFESVPLAMNDPDYAGGCFSDISPMAAADYPAPRLDPLCYPGRRPEYSFMTYSGSVLAARVVEMADGPVFGVAMADGVRNLDAVLAEHSVTPMAERYPVAGFGSNGCPGQLVEKFAEANDRFSDITEANDRLIVPTMSGTMYDVAAAYSSRLGIHGYVFAELIEARGAEADVCVNFLSEGQLKRMIRSESAYELCNVGEVSIHGLSKQISAYGFAGKNEVMLDPSGRPILLADIHQRGVDMPGMTEVEVLEYLTQEFGDQLNAVYPHAPFFANSAANLMAFQSYRREWLRRKSTASLTYCHSPNLGEADELVSTTMQSLLRAAGRTSTDRLLDSLPEEKRNIMPLQFGTLYTAK